MGGLLFFFEARNTPPIHDKSLSDTPKPQLYDKNMPEKLNRKLKLDALTLNQQGMTQVQAADHLGMSRRSVQRAKAKLENYGDVEGGAKQRGRKRLLSPEMEDV